MILLTASLIITILIFIVSSKWIILSIFIITIFICLLYKTPFKALVIKLFKISLFYISFIVLYALFYHSGKIYTAFGFFHFYIEGFYKGLDIFIRGLLAAFFIFSLNIVNRKEEFLQSVSQFFRKFKLIFRIINIYIISLFFIERLLQSGKKDNLHFYNIIGKIHNTLSDIEKEFDNKNYLKQHNVISSSYNTLNEILILFFVLIILIFSIIIGEFFENLF